MNLSNRFPLCLLGATLTVALAQAQPPGPPPAPGHSSPDQKSEHGLFLRHGGAPLEKENVTFLGVETMPVSPTLTAQLSLPKGAGLVISHIVPESPAAAALQPYDVLLKLDDQLLIEPRQFSVLVRNHQDGDQVTLTYVRAGKQATATVKLTKHEVPKMASFEPGNGAGASGFAFAGRGQIPEVDREEMDHVLSLVGPGAATEIRRMHPGGPGNVGFRSTVVNPGNSNIVYSDEKGSLNLTIKDGQKTLVAKNIKDEQIFSGPVTTPEDRKALPPELRERLDRIEGMQGFSFETGDDFHEQLRVFPSEGRKISLPTTRSLEGSAASPAL